MKVCFSKRFAFVSALILINLILLSSPVSASNESPPARFVQSFDADWRFYLGDAANAEQTNFDDSSWRKLDVPHDWSIEGAVDEKNKTGRGGGYFPAGTGWYRKHFTLSDNLKNQRFFIEFDGVMANSDVWINGFHLGKRPYGYVSFAYEITEHLNFGGGKENVIAVRADNSGQPASRWYAGAGIYRHVRFVATNSVHLEQYGTFVSTPQISTNQATVKIQNRVVNQSSAAQTVSLQISILDPSGKTANTIETKPQTIAINQAADFESQIAVRNPQRWDINNPFLYKAVAKVKANGRILDDEKISFGIREFHFDANTGFWLNGKNFKLKGVCLHTDGGAFGAAVPLDVWERRLNELKKIGVNAIRTAHNPPAPEFLDLTDQMGFVVMDELFDAWTVAKNPYDYHLYFDEWSKRDVRDTVRRDRNHPSVVIYSAGNEIHDTPNAELAKRILTGLVATFHENDPTRPVTQALFRPNVSHDYDNGLADILDVVGQNYRENEILAAHEQKPSRKILGTENGHDLKVWLALRDNPPYAGQFIWTGIDYLGESPGYPLIAANFGLLDRTASWRPLAFQRQSWWSAAPTVHITRRISPTEATPLDPGYNPALERRPQVLFSDWTPRNLAAHEENVEVYSNCETVELFLNGKSLGSKPRPADDSPRNWTVNFVAGIITAVGKNGGKTVVTHELKTAGRPAKILLTVDKTKLENNWNAVAFVTATIVDENDVIVPTANDSINFQVSGAGFVAAVDNGDNRSHEPFQASQRKAYQGICFAMIKAKANTGKIIITATAPNMQSGKIVINATAK